MDPEALVKAMLAVRQLIAQSKNPRTAMGRRKPSGVAYSVTHEAIRVYQNSCRDESR